MTDNNEITQSPASAGQPTEAPEPVAPAAPVGVPSFDENWQVDAAGPIEFKLRGEVLYAVGGISLVDREEMIAARREGKLTIGGMYDKILLDEESRKKFWRICSDRTNPVADKTLDEIIEWLGTMWGNSTPGK